MAPRTRPDPTAADRRADLRDFAINAARLVGVAGYLALSFGAAWAILKVGVENPLRFALIWGTVAASALAAGVVMWTIRRMDERERAAAYRAITLGAFAMSGMMMGGAAAHMDDPDPTGDGVAAVAFVALPALLAFAILMPPLMRVFSRRNEC